MFLIVMMTFFAVLALDINVPATVLTAMAAVNSVILARTDKQAGGETA
ncbi:hypothetical protein [Rhizobium halophytocola]|uniref:Uncharacterized protein n=1 Tax=Rhizobium halophytocola TaxID=735519 RepID=A0ABS4DY16_9HYPH|nr:hypothetical protein [Rhizobium halophytocola]